MSKATHMTGCTCMDCVLAERSRHETEIAALREQVSRLSSPSRVPCVMCEDSNGETARLKVEHTAKWEQWQAETNAMAKELRPALARAEAAEAQVERLNAALIARNVLEEHLAKDKGLFGLSKWLDQRDQLESWERDLRREALAPNSKASKSDSDIAPSGTKEKPVKTCPACGHVPSSHGAQGCVQCPCKRIGSRPEPSWKVDEPAPPPRTNKYGLTDAETEKMIEHLDAEQEALAEPTIPASDIGVCDICAKPGKVLVTCDDCWDLEQDWTPQSVMQEALKAMERIARLLEQHWASGMGRPPGNRPEWFESAVSNLKAALGEK